MRLLRLVALLAVWTAGAAGQGQRPLEASLRRGASEPVFYVDQPAYVAVFEVIPGHGVQQLFPRSGSQASRLVEPGEYLLSRPFRSEYGYYGWNNSMPYARPIYMLDSYGRVASYYYTTGWTGAQELSPTRTVLLVASRQPLRLVGSPESARNWLQRIVGFRAISFTVHAPESMLTDIVDAILPLGSSEDDVVVDVLEFDEPMFGERMWAGRSISFACAGGVVSMSAEFFFASGMFYCPPVMPRQNTPLPTPVPGIPVDSTKVEELRYPARKVPKKTDVEDESFRQFRRGSGGAPASPGATVEEGYRQFGRGVSQTPAAAGVPASGVPAAGIPAEEGFRPHRRGFDIPEVGGRSTISVGVPMPVEGWARGGVTPVTSAWVPPSSGLTPSDQGYGAGRIRPEGASNGYVVSRPATGYVPPQTNPGTATASTSSASTTSSAPAATTPPPVAAPAERTPPVRTEVIEIRKKDP